MLLVFKDGGFWLLLLFERDLSIIIPHIRLFSIFPLIEDAVPGGLSLWLVVANASTSWADCDSKLNDLSVCLKCTKRVLQLRNGSCCMTGTRLFMNF